MRALASILSVMGVAAPVEDHTGLAGDYDFRLDWSVGPAVNDAAAPPLLETAMAEQLGLRLIATRGAVQVLVIDHIERPTEN
jgi:uncharacterized protein (TIGR03435 family)